MQERLRYTIRALALFAIAGLSVHAANVDWGQVVLTSVNNLIDVDGDLFADLGIAIVAAAAFVKLFWGLASTVLHYLGLNRGHGLPFNLELLVKVLFQAWALTMILQFWSVPPFGSHSVHQIPMYIADTLVSGTAKSKADQFMDYVKTISSDLETPSPLLIFNVVIYVFILIDMGILSLCMFILTSFAYIGETIFVVITPLTFWCTFFNIVMSWCWNCIQNLFSFAFYKVVGAVIVYILSDVLINFFVTGVGTDYSLDHFVDLFPVVIMLSGLFVFSLLIVPLLCASIFNGAGAIGQAVILAGQKAIAA